MGAIVASTANETVEDYEAAVANFYRTAQHPALHRPYAQAVYQPMVELLRFLEQHEFTCYIVSGGDRNFMRPMTEEYYGIPPEHVVGSALGPTYDAETNDVRYGTSFSLMDDGPEKPVRSWSRIGSRPILARGNSNGDVPMLRFAQGSTRAVSVCWCTTTTAPDARDAPHEKGAEDALAAASAPGSR